MTPDQARRLGTLLHERRSKLGLSTRQLEQASGVDDTSIIRLERGALQRPTMDKLDKLATALGLAIEDVLATAGLTRPDGLPSLRPYLRAKYPQLPRQAEAEVDRYFAGLAAKYGVSLEGPAPGEDETPERPVRKETTKKQKGGSDARDHSNPRTSN